MPDFGFYLTIFVFIAKQVKHHGKEDDVSVRQQRDNSGSRCCLIESALVRFIRRHRRTE